MTQQVCVDYPSSQNHGTARFFYISTWVLQQDTQTQTSLKPEPPLLVVL